MKSIELILVLEGDYINWRKRFRKQTLLSTSHSLAIRQISAGLSDLVHITEAIPYPPKPSWSFRFSTDTKLKDAKREMLRQMRPILSEMEEPLGYKIGRIVTLQFILPKYEFEFPTVPKADYHTTRTLEDLGFSSGDIIVLGYYRPPLATSSFIGEPMFNAAASSSLKGKNLVDFMDSIISDERYSWRVDMWSKEKPRPSSVIGGVVLYTEEDWELARYTRQHYAPLHVLSGHYMTLYFFEHMPSSKSGKGGSSQPFWAERLPAKLNKIWSLLGMTSSKPYLNEQIYHIAQGIGVTPDQIPCIVFFRKWKEIKNDKIILGITRPYPHFFRRACTDVMKAIESYQGDKSEQDFLSSFSLQEFRRHLPRWWHDPRVDDIHVVKTVLEEGQLVHRKKILFLFSCPQDANRLRVDEEERVVRECFERAQLREAITWSSRHAVRVDDLRRAILDEKPDIVHFSGHGTGGTIVLEDEQGNSHPVPIDALGRYLSNRGLECVILNACTTYALGRAIGGTVTIAMPNPISDRAAIEFTRGFYDQIGTGGTLQEAFEEGYLNVELKGLGESFSAEYREP